MTTTVGTSGRIVKEMRVRRRQDFLVIQSEGAKLHGRHVLGIARRATAGEHVDGLGPRGRLGLTITKKIGNAVVRNRIRRRVREWMRLHGWVPAGWDLVLVAKESAAHQAHPDDFAADLTRILRQLT
jgi:ribonuclease P protein component